MKILGRPRDTQDVWADLCGNSNSRARVSAGQTGQMGRTNSMGQMGHTHTSRGFPPKFFMFVGFFPP